MAAKAVAMKDLKRCEECDMYGIPDRFEDAKICVSCRRHEALRQRVCTLGKKIDQLLNDSVNKETQEKQRLEEDQNRIQKFEERLNSIGIEEEIGNKGEIEEKWTTIVKRTVEKEIKVVKDKMRDVEVKIKETAEEERRREERINNIIIHRLEENEGMTVEQGIAEDRKQVLFLFNDVLKINSESKDIKRIFRVGKATEMGTARPLFIEFRDRTTKNEVMESLSKLRYADEKYKKISIAHDMTTSERELCRTMVKECKEKQNAEKSGEWIYRVKGWPGAMKIVKMRKQ